MPGMNMPRSRGGDDLDVYMAPLHGVGAPVGRFANRIAGGQFLIDGQRHHVDRTLAAGIARTVAETGPALHLIQSRTES